MQHTLSSTQRAFVALLVVSAWVLVACSSDDSGTAGETPTELGADETAAVESISEERTKPAGPPWQPEPVQVDATVWFGGFEIVVEEARVIPDPPDPILDLDPGDDPDTDLDEFRPTHGTVEIDVLATNPGNQPLSLAGPFMLHALGTDHRVTSTDLPPVPAGGSNRGVLRFRVEAGFEFDDAVLTIGEPEVRRSVVPLGSGGSLVSNEPIVFAVDTSADGADVVAVLGAARIEAHDLYSPLPVGSAKLTIDMDVTYDGPNRHGVLIAGTAISLQLPDGTAIAPENYALRTYVYPGTTERGLELSFLIDDPSEGDYVLLLAVAPESDRGEIAVPFTIPDPNPGSADK